MSAIIVCSTPEGCTCGAPASTPRGMHHCDCAIHPGWCGQAGCLPCERNGQLKPTKTAASGRRIETVELPAEDADARAALTALGVGEG